MTNQGTLIEFMKAAWTLASPLGTAEIYWSEEWYNNRKDEYPQITVTPITEPELQRFRGATSMGVMTRPLYMINCWKRVPDGADGTKELDMVEQMRKEVFESFRRNFPDYGGSLSPFGVVLPTDKGISRHELNITPHTLRYEVVVMATEHFGA